MVARYERGEGRLRISLSVVEASGRLQENQRRGIGSIGDLRDRNVLAKRFDVLQEDDIAQWLTFEPIYDVEQIVGRTRHWFCHLGSILVNCTAKYGVRNFAFSTSLA